MQATFSKFIEMSTYSASATPANPANPAKRQRRGATPDSGAGDLREHILQIASSLFYKEGVRAIGVDLIVERAGIAKTSLYRYFPTKDALVAAFLEQEDVDFWATWDAATAKAEGNALRELTEQLVWIAERLGRDNYRGCPQLNVTAEFSDPAHPARLVAKTHMEEMLRRLNGIAERSGAKDSAQLGVQLSLLINGAFVSSSIVPSVGAYELLRGAAYALLRAQGVRIP
jgi:AcrR family transcriptional regulator